MRGMWWVFALWIIGASIAIYGNYIAPGPHIYSDDAECGAGSWKYDC